MPKKGTQKQKSMVQRRFPKRSFAETRRRLLKKRQHQRASRKANVREETKNLNNLLNNGMNNENIENLYAKYYNEYLPFWINGNPRYSNRNRVAKEKPILLRNYIENNNENYDPEQERIYLEYVEQREREAAEAAFRERERAEAEAQKRAIQPFLDRFPKNTYIIRVDAVHLEENLLKPSQLLDDFREHYPSHWNDWEVRGYTTLEIFYRGETLESSVYVLFCYRGFYDDNTGYWKYGWEAVHLDPALFFDFYLDLDTFYENITDAMDKGVWIYHTGRSLGFLESGNRMRQYIERLPGFTDQAERERMAVYTAPGKMKSLQQKGLNALLQTMEKEYKKNLPPDTRNIIESYLFANRPHRLYIQGRNNLGKINTSLFSNNEVE
jgi:hypothetical protein